MSRDCLEYKVFLFRLRSGEVHFPRAVGKSSTAETLSVHVRKDIVAEVAARAEALSMQGKGSYAVKILEWWFASGCPAVTPADQAMQDLKALRAAEDKQANYGTKKRSA